MANSPQNSPYAPDPTLDALNILSFGSVSLLNATDAINHCVAQITSANINATQKGAIYFPPRTYTLSTSCTVPAGVRLIMEHGAILSVASGKTLTINGVLTAPMSQIFAGSGTVTLGGQIPEVFAEWWGVYNDGTNDDVTAINKANTCSSAPTTLLNKTYWIGSPINMPHKLLRGQTYNNSCMIKALPAFSGAAMIQPAATGHTQQAMYLEKFWLHGNTGNATVPIGLYLTGGVGQVGYVKDVVISACSGNGLKIDDVTSFFLENIWVTTCGDDNILITHKHATAAGYAAFMVKMNGVASENPASGKAALHILGDAGTGSSNVRNIWISGLHMEVVGSNTGLLIDSAGNILVDGFSYFGSGGTGDLVQINGAAADSYNIELRNVQRTTGALTNTILDNTSSQTITDTSVGMYHVGTYAGGAITFGSDLYLSGTAPAFRMTDTTASAKSLTVITDANKSTFQESGGAANSLLVLDLANARVGVGQAPGFKFNILFTANGWGMIAEDGTVQAGFGSDGSTQAMFGTRSNHNLLIRTNNTTWTTLSASGNLVHSVAALATTATDGFLYIPTCAGAPTGVPTSYTGRAPLILDTTNGRFYLYYGGAWHYATLT